MSQAQLDALFLAFCAEVGNAIYEPSPDELAKSQEPRFDYPGSDVNDGIERP